MGLRFSKGLCIGGAIWCVCAIPLIEEHDALRAAIAGLLAFGFGWTMFDHEIRKDTENRRG